MPSDTKVDVAPKRMKDICFGKAEHMKDKNSKNKITASKRKLLAFSPSWLETAKKKYKNEPIHAMNFVILLKKILRVLAYGK